MDAKKTLQKLKGESDRIRVSLYLSQSILGKFKEACQGISPSRVMEELMLEFVDNLEKSKVKKSKKS